MTQITEEETLIFNSLVYIDEVFSNYENKSIYELVNDLKIDKNSYSAEMKKEDLERIKETVIKNKDVYENF